MTMTPAVFHISICHFVVLIKKYSTTIQKDSKHRTMKSTLVFLATAALSTGISESFSTPTAAVHTRPTTALSMMSSSDDKKKNTFAASVVAAAYLLANVVSSDAAFAMDAAFDSPSSTSDFTQSSSVIIAARSGGRAGGRAAPRMVSRPSSSSSTRVINRTTVIAPPPIVMGGGYGGYGGYYDPTPGIGEFVVFCGAFCCHSTRCVIFIIFIAAHSSSLSINIIITVKTIHPHIKR